MSTSSTLTEKNVGNLCELPYSDVERIVGYMRTRWLNDKVHTWAGNVLLCVQTYKNGDRSLCKCDSSLPSIESVVDRLWFRMRNNISGHSSAAIVVSGESGAGKTYSTCMAIKSIAKKTIAGDEDAILRQIWASVPLLTAFGNAPTSLNNNSSRFGKLLRLQYINGNLRGALIETYLIEKSRVCNVNATLGNFHIFRQILDSLSTGKLATLQLANDIDYCIAPKAGLKSTYAETLKSMEVLHLEHELDNILHVLAVILNLGNVGFCKDHENDCFIVNSSSLMFIDNVAGLLQVSSLSLCDLLCTMQFSTSGNKNKRNSVYKLACTNNGECEIRRDAILKMLYERLFRWLVNVINFRIFLGNADQYINLLDLYGFEVFDENRFEQLCINYANERLQQYFAQRYLADERRDLLIDGFQVDRLTEDVTGKYTERIGMIDGSISIFGILNEECALKRFKSDLYVTQRFAHELRSHGRHFFVNNEQETLFTIRHYASNVKYDAVSMVVKNRDRCPEEIVTFLRMCNFDFLKVLLPQETETKRASGSNRRTVLTYFKKSFDELIGIFDKCDVHYVKCLKPNGYQIPEFFDDEYFAQQMATNGVFEILKLSFQNYSIKMPIERFTAEIGVGLFEILRIPLSDNLHMSKRHIFMHQHTYVIFIKFRNLQCQRAVRCIQTAWQRYNQRRHQAAAIIQSFVRRHIVLQRGYYNLDNTFAIVGNEEKIDNNIYAREKIESYLASNSVETNFEGAPLSLPLERVYNNIGLTTQKFNRTLFVGNRIVSYHKLAEIPVRFHLAKTCIRFSHLLPKSELPQGLPDLL